MQIFDGLLVISLNKYFNKQYNGQWNETPWCSCGVSLMIYQYGRKFKSGIKAKMAAKILATNNSDRLCTGYQN